MKIAGVVVWYNPTEEDKQNIDSYIKELDKLYIYDNSANVNDYKKNKKIEYIFNGNNDGIAKALNVGAENAIRDGYKWILTMDQDTIFESLKLKELKKHINESENNVAIICPWLQTRLKIKKPQKKIDNPLDVMTSGNLLNLDIYKIVGGFKNEYFIDGVDMEYCLRLKKFNYKIKRINTISIKHNLGNIEYKNFLHKQLLCMNHNYVGYYYRMRNYHYISDEYNDIAKDYCKSILKFRATVFCVLFYEKDKLRKLRALIDGYIDYKKNIKGKYVK